MPARAANCESFQASNDTMHTKLQQKVVSRVCSCPVPLQHGAEEKVHVHVSQQAHLLVSAARPQPPLLFPIPFPPHTSGPSFAQWSGHPQGCLKHAGAGYCPPWIGIWAQVCIAEPRLQKVHVCFQDSFICHLQPVMIRKVVQHSILQAPDQHSSVHFTIPCGPGPNQA